MKNQYLPALRFTWLTRFYDPLVRITTKEFEFKRTLLNQAKIQNHHSILDLACGTGTLSLAINRRFPDAKVFALDADSEILKTAESKASKNNSQIEFCRGFSNALPYSDNNFDIVFSTLSFHHLDLKTKRETLNEILRVLKKDGKFHIADYGIPENKSQKLFSNIIRYFDGEETTNDNLNGRLGLLMEESGFSKVERTGHFKTILGTIRLFRLTK